MRRHKSLGLGIVSALFLGSMIAACSASGNDPTVEGSGPGAANDSGAAADTSYNYGDSSSDIPHPDGSTSTPIDSGSSTPPPVVDSGPAPTSADCDVSGSGAETYIGELASGGDGDCGSGDSCSAGDCCFNIASFIGGGGSIPAPILALLGGGSGAPSTCVAQ